MYCCIDEKKNIIAIHDDKDVVETYRDLIQKMHNIELSVGKIKKKMKNKLEKFSDLYLVRYGNTYVQSGYLLYLQLCSEQVKSDNRYAKDILLRLLETSRLNNKDAKKIMKAIEVMDKIEEEDNNYFPSLNELKGMKEFYDPYIYNSGLYDHL